MKIPPSLLKTDYCAYSDVGAANKEALHKDGKKFLRELAKMLGLEKTDYDLRSNLGGIAVSGEVTLHTDKTYVQISEGWSGQGLTILHRTCRDRDDCCGGANHHVDMRDLVEPYRFQAFFETLQQMQAEQRETRSLPRPRMR